MSFTIWDIGAQRELPVPGSSCPEWDSLDRLRVRPRCCGQPLIGRCNCGRPIYKNHSPHRGAHARHPLLADPEALAALADPPPINTHITKAPLPAPVERLLTDEQRSLLRTDPEAGVENVLDDDQRRLLGLDPLRGQPPIPVHDVFSVWDSELHEDVRMPHATCPEWNSRLRFEPRPECCGQERYAMCGMCRRHLYLNHASHNECQSAGDGC